MECKICNKEISFWKGTSYHFRYCKDCWFRKNGWMTDEQVRKKFALEVQDE